jgi:sarcosine oxidase, subunit gamma
MPEAAAPRSALTEAPAFHLPPAGAQVAIGERAGSTLLHLEGAPAGADLEAVLADLGIATLPVPGTSGGTEGAAILCVGPAAWLVVLPEGARSSRLSLAGAVGRAFEVALDMSHAWTRLGIAGAMATELLSKGSALDLHPRMFPPGACAAAGFARLRTILWRSLDGARFDLFVGRSHAVALWEWLTEAAAEYEGSAASER